MLGGFLGAGCASNGEIAALASDFVFGDDEDFPRRNICNVNLLKRMLLLRNTKQSRWEMQHESMPSYDLKLTVRLAGHLICENTWKEQTTMA